MVTTLMGGRKSKKGTSVFFSIIIVIVIIISIIIIIIIITIFNIKLNNIVSNVMVLVTLNPARVRNRRKKKKKKKKKKHKLQKSHFRFLRRQVFNSCIGCPKDPEKSKYHIFVVNSE